MRREHFSCPVTNSKRALHLYFTTSRSFPSLCPFLLHPQSLFSISLNTLSLSQAKGSQGERSVVAGLQIKFHMTEHLFYCGPLERKCLKELACLSLGEGLWSSTHQVSPAPHQNTLNPCRQPPPSMFAHPRGMFWTRHATWSSWTPVSLTLSCTTICLAQHKLLKGWEASLMLSQFRPGHCCTSELL